jgi:drug/metabolite transporter (DMT)-like permease
MSAAVATAGMGPTHRGLVLGLLGVVLFALTLPMTRLAGGSVDAPQLPPDFVAVGRAAVAGLLSVAYLLVTRAPWPRRSQWPLIGASAAGVVFGFPLFMGWAVREVPAMHAAVITGVLPLATAVVAAVWLRQRPSFAFWACAVAGCALVVAYAAAQGGGALQWADGLLLCAVASAAFGYVGGTRLVDQGLAPEQAICWMLVASLPLTLPGALWLAFDGAPALAAAKPAAWAAFVYVSLVSMWLGFFAWYRGLALGGALRVSQVQLLQPFVSILAAVPLLGERVTPVTIAFALAVIASVVIGQRVALQPHPR